MIVRQCHSCQKRGACKTWERCLTRLSTTTFIGSTVAIADGLVYAADFEGRLHCLDAESGQCYWVYRVGGPIWGSPLAADGKVYLGTGRQTFWVFKAGKELNILNKIRMHDALLTTPVAANGVLYVMTNRHLYAVAE